MEREFLASFSIDQRARAPQRSPRPPGEGAPERGAGAPILGDATVAAHISTRAIAALHPAPGSHPSTIRLEPAPPFAGAGVREQRLRCPGEGMRMRESSRSLRLDARALIMHGLFQLATEGRTEL